MDCHLTQLYAKRAVTRFNRGDYDDAVDDFNKAIERQPTDPKLYCGRGGARYKQGDYDRAILDCDIAIRIES